ncbi:MAG: DUF5329 family protein [Planctomycetota bacterium]
MALLLSACSEATNIEATEVAAAPPPPPFALPISFSVQQRATAEIPDTNGDLRVALGDISGDQVHTVISSSASGPLAEASLHAGEVLAFQLQEFPLQLQLVEIHNLIIGQDSADFVLGSPGVGAISESERIEELLSALESQVGCVFIRNGSEYTAAQAAEHLRGKLSSKRSEVRSLDDFISLCASKSSLSGKDYRIRRADGKEVTSAEFLKELAGKLDDAR